MRHPHVVRLGRYLIDEFVVAHHGNQSRRRIGQRKRAVIEPGTAPEPHPGAINRERRHQDDRRGYHRTSRQGGFAGLE